MKILFTTLSILFLIIGTISYLYYNHTPLNTFYFLTVLFGILAVVWNKSPEYYQGHSK